MVLWLTEQFGNKNHLLTYEIKHRYFSLDCRHYLIYLIKLTIYIAIKYIGVFSTLLPLCFFVIFQKKNNKRDVKVIFFYFLFCVLNEILPYFFSTSPNLKPFLSAIYYIFTVGELGFFLAYFYLISATKTVKLYIKIIYPLFICYILIDYLFLPKGNIFSPVSAGAEAILIITLCMYYFYEQIKEPNIILIYTQQSFWIIIAFLFFQSGTFFVYLYLEKVLLSEAYINLYSSINSFFAIFKNILFSIAMLKMPEVKVSSDFPNENFMPDWNNIQSLKNVK